MNRFTKTVAAAATAVAGIGAAVALTANPAFAASVGDYQVDVIRCPITGNPDSHTVYDTLSSASQREVDVVVYQATHAHHIQQVRLVKITGLNPTITQLVSSNEDTC